MVKKVLSVSRISIKLVAFIVCLCMVSEVSAGLITGSDNTVEIIGTGTGGSFKVQVDYAVYNGADTSDPLGLTSDYQIEFILEHLGTGGKTPVLNFGRFLVFAPEPLSTDPFYSGMYAVGTGKAPSDYQWNWDPDYGLYDIDGTVDGMYLELPSGGLGSNNAQFIFVNASTAMIDFTPGEISKQLVVTVAKENLPTSVILEIDLTDTVVHGDVVVEFIPEPASVALFGIGSFLLSLRRRRKA